MAFMGINFHEKLVFLSGLLLSVPKNSAVSPICLELWNIVKVIWWRYEGDMMKIWRWYEGDMMKEEGLMRHVTHYADGSVLTWRYVDGTFLTSPDWDGAGLKWTDATNCMQEVSGGRYMTCPHKIYMTCPHIYMTCPHKICSKTAIFRYRWKISKHMFWGKNFGNPVSKYVWGCQ